MSFRTTFTNSSYKGYQGIGSGGGPSGSWAFFQNADPVYNWNSTKIANNSQTMALQYATSSSAIVTVYDLSTGQWIENNSNWIGLNPQGSKPSTCYSINEDGTYVSIGGRTFSTTGTVNILNKVGNTYSLQQTITPNDAPKLNFGAATAINYTGDKLLVGEAGNAAANTIGSVYYFTRSGNTWTQQQKFVWANANSSQETVQIQFPKDDTKCIIAAGTGQTGRAYYFTRSGNTWTQQQQITASYGGFTISGDGNTIIQNNGGRTSAPSINGFITFYKWNGVNSYTSYQTLNNPAGAAPQNFGIGIGTNFDASMICTGSGDSAANFQQHDFIFTIIQNTNSGNYFVSEKFTIPDPKDRFYMTASDNNWLIAPVTRSTPSSDETYIYTRV